MALIVGYGLMGLAWLVILGQAQVLLPKAECWLIHGLGWPWSVLVALRSLRG